METLAISFMVISAIYMVFTFLYLRDIDNKESENTRLIRHDIIERGNYISTAIIDCGVQVSNMEKNLTTEIACLATKNNEDIKRLNGNYTVGDLLRFDGTRWRVFCKDILDDGRTRWKLFGENGEEYRIYTDAIPADLEFLGHRDLSFD